MKVLVLALAVVALILEAGQNRYPLPHWLPVDLITTMIGFGAFLIAFGFVSRRFERQADVFAARTLERERAPEMTASTHVGPAGASVFASALERVAAINNMSIGTTRRWEGGLARRIGFILEFMGDAANNWLHGSIAQRMQALHDMSGDPSHTHRFDRRMARLYVTLVVLLVVSGAVAWGMKIPM